MSTTTRLTCDQTPLAWPASVAITDLTVCNGCAIHLAAPRAGSLQVTTRRAGAGDGVNIEEDRGGIALDYRGQRYTLQDAIFQTPGLHIFPGQEDVYPAEYHLHFQTYATPQRQLTLVVPISHRVTGDGVDYFAAVRAQPDPEATRPTLLSLFASTPTIDTIQFLGPDLRGRTSETPSPPDVCSPTAMENMMALVLRPCQIRATDLERIPREGSLSTDVRDLPVQPRLKPTATVPRTALLTAAVLARPGLQTGVGPAPTPAPTPTPNPSTELECYPLEVKDGKDVINKDGTSIPLTTLLFGNRGLGATEEAAASMGVSPEVLQAIAAAAATLITILWTIVIWRTLRMWMFKPSPTLGDFTWLFGILVLVVGITSGAMTYFT
jgi:hypothetical protein